MNSSSVTNLIDAVSELVIGQPSDRAIVLALDGRSGAGKSTVAAALAGALNAAVVRGDDFYRDMDVSQRWALGATEGSRLYFDWQRLRDQAIVPLRSMSPARYMPFDWSRGVGLSSTEVDVSPGPVVIVEGVYAARPELADLIDVAALVETTEATRFRRMSERGHANDGWHSRWEAAEKYYFSTVRRRESFDTVLLGE